MVLTPSEYETAWCSLLVLREIQAQLAESPHLLPIQMVDKVYNAPDALEQQIKVLEQVLRAPKVREE